jgi:hypothetical protein
MRANALVAFDPDDAAAQAVLTRLHEGRIVDGDTVYWQGQGESTTYGSGDVMTIETTALAAYAMLRAGVYSEDMGGAASFLVGQKDSFGNWHTTQATILTLRFMLAMVEMASQPGPATVSIFAHDELVETLEIDEATSDVLRLVDLGEQTVEGENALRIDIEGDSSYLYQIVTRYYAPWDSEDGAPADGPLSLEVSYDRTTLAVDEMVTATVEVTNTVPESTAKMVLVDLGIPPGFELITDTLKTAVKEGRLQKFEKTARQLILYIEAIPADTPFNISYQLKAQYPLVASSGESETHPYYTPDNSTQTEPVEFVVE